MSRKQKEHDPTCPFQSINDAVRTTGLSSFYIRTGCKNNTVPHIRAGNTYLINVPLLLDQLNKQSMSQVYQTHDISHNT